jgi:Putative peptidoglycan binding domain
VKTKFVLFTLVASVALIGQAQAGGRHSGARGTGRSSAGSRAIPSRGAYYHSSPMRSYSGRMRYSGIHSSPYANRSTAFRQPYVHSSRSVRGNLSRFSAQRYNGARHFARSGNNSQFTRSRTGNVARGNGAIQNRATRAGRLQNRNSLRANWRSHVFARHSTNWHRDWDRRHEHWWHGHRCCFINGSWFVFDLGFYPWWPWPYWYPSDYYYGYPYAYNGYPYDYYGDGYSNGYDPGYYDPGAYQGGEYYYYDQNADQNGDSQYDQNTGSSVAAMQERLAREGYYHGRIDGIMGPETRQALEAYRRDHPRSAGGGGHERVYDSSPSDQ